MQGAGELGASGATCTITLTSAESWNPLTEPVSLKAATGIAGSVHHRGEGRRSPPGSSRRLGGHDEDWLRWRSPERTRAVNPLPTDPRQAARGTTPPRGESGEDPAAPNYDPRHRVFRSPFQSSVGPWLRTDDVEAVKSILHGPYPGKNLPWEPKPMGQHASLYPVIAQLEPDWYEKPERVPEIIDTFNRVVLNSDSANNLAATALVTNAYLYTGEEEYRRWVLDYVEAWLERIRANGGIIPDNVGPTGKPGERRDGVWWGGMYGWNSKFGCRMIPHAITIAAECALLLSGDFGYLELLRSQLHVLLDNAIHDGHGRLLVPWCPGATAPAAGPCTGRCGSVSRSTCGMPR